MLFFKPEPIDGGAVITAFEGGQELGGCTVMLGCERADCAAVTRISAPAGREDAAEGLLRTALNFAANRLCYVAQYRAEEFVNVAQALGFDYRNGVLEGEIPSLLQGTCAR